MAAAAALLALAGTAAPAKPQRGWRPAVAGTGGTVTDRFEGFGAHLYLVGPAGA